jgi:hypothetical protein
MAITERPKTGLLTRLGGIEKLVVAWALAVAARHRKVAEVASRAMFMRGRKVNTLACGG